MVDRVVAAVSPGLRAPAYLVATVQNFICQICADPDFRGGDYYDGVEPTRAVVSVLRQLALLNQSPVWAENTFGRRWAVTDKDPVEQMENQFLIDAALEKTCSDRLSEVDANSLLYWSRAVALYAIDGHGGSIASLRAPVLFIPCRSDLLLHPQYTFHAVEELRAQGTPVEVFELDSDAGHYACILDFESALPVIQEFVDRRSRPSVLRSLSA
jgi:homoserine O-acetyltransferase/O-succinyltransferase